MKQGQEWWRGAVLYQIYLPSFCDSNGDGVGDLPGLLRHLDHVASLGVDAIWISPFYRSPMQDFGYDVADYRAVDPLFGTLADFDEVVARAHGLGLKVVIDQVWSHTAAEHSWFKQSRASRTGPMANWYVWADPRPDGMPPNNWLSVFGGSAWQWEPQRRQYYLHHFLTSQPKLNLRHESVMEAHFGNARFWLDHGVDGFRLDAIDFMLHDESLRDNPSVPPANGLIPWNPFRLQRHIHDMCQPDALGLMRDIRRFTDQFPDITTIGEVSSEVGALDRIAAMTGGATHLHMAYTLGVMKSAFAPSMIRNALRDAVSLNQNGWLCWSFSNHDVDRVASRWNPEGHEPAAFARLQMALLMCLPGSICLYQGEELGLANGHVPPAAIQDPFGRTFYPAFAGRDGSRTPMPWVLGARNSGFSTAFNTWLPVDPAHDALAVDTQEDNSNSTLASYRNMLAWRKNHPALVTGDLDMIEVPEPLVAWRRRLNGDRVVAVFNFAPEPVTIPMRDLPAFSPAQELGFATMPEDGALRLPPFGISIGQEDSNRQLG